MTRSRIVLLCLGVLLGLAACGPGTQATPPPSVPAGSIGPRPSSPASLTVVEPKDGAIVNGTTVHVVFDLQNATITTSTTTHIQPDLGHIHLYVDNVLVSMNYQTQDDITLTPGAHALKGEFVASDHVPFDPRVWSNQVVFTVQ
jgi:Domain of unknown function (DUF4399)